MLFERDSQTGDAVQFAPVSARIPCKQGILRGIVRFRGSESELPNKKPLRRSEILSSSLRKLKGKIFRRIRILQIETGKTAKEITNLVPTRRKSRPSTRRSRWSSASAWQDAATRAKLDKCAEFHEFEIGRLGGATIDSRVHVRLSDGTQIRAVGIILAYAVAFPEQRLVRACRYVAGRH